MRKLVASGEWRVVDRLSTIEFVCFQLALELNRTGLTELQRARIVAAAMLLIESQEEHENLAKVQ